MARRTSLSSSTSQRALRSLTTQSAQLAVAVPQVVAHRLTRMALAGAHPNSRDRREFARMGTEKLTAFQASWQAMGLQLWLAQQALAQAWWRSMWMPWASASSVAAAPGALWGQWQAQGWRTLHKGLAPVHRTAVANARRLGRTPLAAPSKA